MTHSNKCVVSIGGIGGSGTRVVAEIVGRLGFFLGYELNSSLDTLLFTYFFKRKSILVDTKDQFYEKYTLFKKLMQSPEVLSSHEKEFLYELAEDGNEQHNTCWLQSIAKTHLTVTRNHKKLWGWKEPNTHIVIDRLLEIEKDLKFIYVYRNGLDMAFSGNQNQLKLWGDVFLNQEHIQISPKNSLSFWVKAHQRMLRLKQLFPHQILLLDFDLLCKEPGNSLNQLYNFLDIHPSEKLKDILSTIPSVPSSLGRHRLHNLKNFNPGDLKFVQNYFSFDYSN